MFAYAKPEQKQESKSTAQKKSPERKTASPNLTGIPDAAKTHFENLSGFSFDDVRVHYNSDKPAQLQAPAYTQGNHVHTALGQEKHLGHLIQQKRETEKTVNSIRGMPVNNDKASEKEAESLFEMKMPHAKKGSIEHGVIQRRTFASQEQMWDALCPGYGIGHINTLVDHDPQLRTVYNDAVAQIPNCDFVSGENTRISPRREGLIPPFTLTYKPFPVNWRTKIRSKTPDMLSFLKPNPNNEQNFYVSSIIHELTHAANRSYRNQTNLPTRNQLRLYNMNFPANEAEIGTSVANQMGILVQNVEGLRQRVDGDIVLSREIKEHLRNRLHYLDGNVHVEYDTVLVDMMFYLQANKLHNSNTYLFMNRMLSDVNERRQGRRDIPLVT